ncbi:adenosylmethionine decarboxylase [Pseudomonas sp. ABY48]|uniref:adenosylmethionine decarboxylase n=1 Tax=Pseudomonas sp. ABY48 TaxID=3402865 RepID=UPI003B436DEF
MAFIIVSGEVMQNSECVAANVYVLSDQQGAYVGKHLLVDFYGAKNIDSVERVSQALVAGVKAAGATLLHQYFHYFTPNGGVSGVCVLAESHISIHSWPEFNYAAVDIFMCGDADPHRAVEVLKQSFSPSSVLVDEIRRGKNIT